LIAQTPCRDYGFQPITASARTRWRLETLQTRLSSTLVSPQEWEARGFVDAEKLEQKERSGVAA
jgi:hypothetical protein